MFMHERAQIILRRTEVLAWVFMVLVPMWLAVDVLIFPSSVVISLVYGRLLVTLFLGAVLVFSVVMVERASWLTAYFFLICLVAIPEIFEIFAHSVFYHWQINNLHITATQSAAIFLYRQLPIVYISGLALFPLTLLESLPILLAMLVLVAISHTGTTDPLAFSAALVAELWLVVVIGGSAVLAGLLQFNLFWQRHRLADFDAETGLLTKQAALELIKLFWDDQAQAKRYIGVGMMAIPQASAAAPNRQSDSERLSREVTYLEQHLPPGMQAVRWSSHFLGVIATGYSYQELRDLMNTLYDQTDSPSNPYGGRNVIVAERAIDHSISPANLLSTAEKKLKRALRSRP
ncbi:MAG TPA: hypothetical protein ENI75_00890 [Mizugakiibacter sp.]|nr:hypothetical protein [Mizugakiibacter sp.]